MSMYVKSGKSLHFCTYSFCIKQLRFNSAGEKFMVTTAVHNQEVYIPSAGVNVDLQTTIFDLSSARSKWNCTCISLAFLRQFADTRRQQELDMCIKRSRWLS